MATLANAITELNSRRNELVDNLNVMGVEASTSENLLSLVPKVLEIETAGAVESQEIVEPLDPYVVYKNTRPSDWLEMPAVSDGEMYLLFHLSPPTDNLIAFTVGGDYTVEYGTVVNGTFV